MNKKFIILIIFILLIVIGGFFLWQDEEKISGSYVCTESGSAFGSSCEIKFDDRSTFSIMGVSIYTPSGNFELTGDYQMEGSEIVIISQSFYGDTWQGVIQKDTINFEDGSTWIKQK